MYVCMPLHVMVGSVTPDHQCSAHHHAGRRPCWTKAAIMPCAAGEAAAAGADWTAGAGDWVPRLQVGSAIAREARDAVKVR